MAKVYLTDEERSCARLAKWVYGELRVRKLSQRAVANKMHISHQALSQKLRHKSFDFKDFVFFVKEFKPDEKELQQIIGI